MISSNEYYSFISNAFSDANKYIVGIKLNDLIQKYFDISSDHSRKIIQRAVKKNVIYSSSPLTFGKGQYVYSKQNIKLNKDTVKLITKEYRPPIYRLLEILDINGGILSYYEALKITSSPVKKTTTKVNTIEEIIQDLKSINLIDEVQDQSGAKYLIYSTNHSEKEQLIESHNVKMYLDSVFLSDILRWLRKHNLIDNSNIRFRNKSNPSICVTHNDLVWDAFAYTKTTGIDIQTSNHVNKSDSKQTLVVLDVVINREYSDEDLQGFLSRVQIIINSVRTGERKVMPIVVSQDTSMLVANRISKLGFIHLSLGTVFGEKIYDIIKKINIIKIDQIHKLENPEQFIKNIDDALQTMNETGQEENLGNIKGDLFEALLYPILYHFYPNSIIEHGKKLKSKDKKKEYEYDFVITCYEVTFCQVNFSKITHILS